MSDIKVGDLVMVIKPRSCCGFSGGLGQIFTAGNTYIGPAQCSICRAQFRVITAVWDGIDVVEKNRLRRIDPLSELESTEHKEETPA